MRFSLLTAFALFFLLVSGLHAETSNRVVAFVNDNVITLYELNSKIEELTGKTYEEIRSEDEQSFFAVRDEILDMLIDEKLTEAKIRELDLKASKDEVDNYIEYIKENNKMTHEDLVSQLKNDGMTFKKFRDRIKKDMERRRLIEREITSKMIITDEDISTYYQSHKKEYETPGKTHMASIFLIPDSSGHGNQLDKLREKGEDILARLKDGEDFGDLARKFSNGPGAEEGGDLGSILLSDLDAQILEVIYALEDGEVSPVINRGNSLQIIKLIKKSEKGWVPLEDLSDDIFQLLNNERMEKSYKEYMSELRKSNYTKKKL